MGLRTWVNVVYGKMTAIDRLVLYLNLNLYLGQGRLYGVYASN